MIILGICGFEDLSPPESRHVYSSPADSLEGLLDFSREYVPLQYFPLHLIGHDSSATVLKNGNLIAFGAEERFSRIKHGFNLAGRTVLPRKAIEYCLNEAGVTWRDIDYIAHYCHFTKDALQRRFSRVNQELGPGLAFVLEREYQLAFRLRLDRNILLNQIADIADQEIPDEKFVQVKHHLSHAAATFFSSGFREALILTIDGYGEEESSLWGIGQGNRILPCGSIDLPTSLGLLYQIISVFLGFRAFGDEYKVMGLSSYGQAEAFLPLFEELIEPCSDGAYRINQLSRPDLSSWLKEKFGTVSDRNEFSQKKADIAAALQQCLERVLLRQLSVLKEEHKLKKLCIAGGVGLNACANGAILRSGLFDEVYFQPAAGDDGAGLGAAKYVHHQTCQNSGGEPVRHVFWGPNYQSSAVENLLRKTEGINWRKEPHIEEVAATKLEQGCILGWFQGRMEMGPRALGARSILADPRKPELRDKINALIKRREEFRPFAPSVLRKEASIYFQIPADLDSPYMLATFATQENKRHLIPAVVHVDGSARLQTVDRVFNPRYYRLLECFFERTGIPLVLNTSFNRAGEPIVNSPENALKCFLACQMDALVIEDYIVEPAGQSA